ncbi:MAG: serpin family protein, partial [Planctomycetota bacterium]
MRRHLHVFAILLFIFPGLHGVRAEFAYIPFEKLVADNPVIVAGKIESKKQDRTNARYDIGYIRVAEVLKNTLDKPSIRVGGKIPLSMPSEQRKSIDILYGVGQEGIWILDYREERFWASYPDDLQPLNKKHEILSLIESQKNNSGTIVTGNSEFALDLYSKLKGQKGNLFFSPYSISTALAMVYGGARGQTEKQMAEVLHFSLSQEKLHPEFGALERRLNAAGQEGNYQLSVANALWGQKGYEFLPEFLNLAKQNYSAGLEEVDFVGETEKTRKIINDWIEKKTQNKIKELIKPGILDALTRLVLTNAIYFKGLWEHEFDKEATSDASFTTSAFKKVDVPMMKMTENFKYWGDDNLQVLELPYKGKDLSMMVLLPRSVDRLNRLEALLSLENVNKWLQQLRRRKV